MFNLSSTDSQMTVLSVLGLEIVASLSGLASSVVIVMCLISGIEYESQLRKHAQFLCIGSGKFIYIGDCHRY